jgi:TetR/AcrR family transcriptional regulator
MQDSIEDGRKKKRRRRKEARPAEIISAAMQLWKDRGFSATRLEDVAAGAGIAKSTIYLYFPSKEALFEAAVQERLVATMERAKGVAQGFDGPTETLLLRFFETIRSEMVEGGAFVFLKVLLSEGHRFPDLVARYETVVLRRGMETVRGIFTRGVERGELRPEAADCDPRLVMAPAMMLALWGTVFRGVPVPDVHRVLRQHVSILLRSFGRD